MHSGIPPSPHPAPPVIIQSEAKDPRFFHTTAIKNPARTQTILELIQPLDYIHPNVCPAHPARRRDRQPAQRRHSPSGGWSENRVQIPPRPDRRHLRAHLRLPGTAPPALASRPAPLTRHAPAPAHHSRAPRNLPEVRPHHTPPTRQSHPAPAPRPARHTSDQAIHPPTRQPREHRATLAPALRPCPAQPTAP